ncbi:MAG: hypothetical protein Ct9H300mP18_04820 [Candidatus Neomarinimicrobiota bacterium]|nr:MAG: hypothetical protein Ct9H300mP18_04820 [Candidatus Neomarinimicrobiota bacterium]
MAVDFSDLNKDGEVDPFCYGYDEPISYIAKNSNGNNGTYSFGYWGN